MSSLDLNSYAAALKTLYAPTMGIELYENQPALAVLPKDTTWQGDYMMVPIMYANASGGSFDFSVAQSSNSAAGGGPGQYVRFQLTPGFDYAVGTITGQIIRASGTNKGALMKALEAAYKAAMNTFDRSTGVLTYGNGGAARARLTATPTGGGPSTYTISRSQAVFLEKGMWVQFQTTDGTSTGTVRGNAQIASINRVATSTTATFTTTTAFPVGTIGGDYIVRLGDTSASTGLVITSGGWKGFGAWLPTTAPTAGDSFFGLDRSVDDIRLAGNRIVGNGAPKEEVLQDASAQLYTEGGKPTHCFCNPLDFRDLINSLGSKVNYIRTSGEGQAASLGFKAVEVYGPTGPFAVLPDPNCPQGTAYLIQKDTWKLYSMGPFPGFLKEDGLTIRAVYNADAYEFRIGSYPQLGCNAPGKNAVITW